MFRWATLSSRPRIAHGRRRLPFKGLYIRVTISPGVAFKGLYIRVTIRDLWGYYVPGAIFVGFLQRVLIRGSIRVTIRATIRV